MTNPLEAGLLALVRIPGCILAQTDTEPILVHPDSAPNSLKGTTWHSI
jgi:hypothetical protein